MGKYQCTVDLPFDWFGISCMTTDNFGFYLQNRLIQTSQTGGQWYSETSPICIPCIENRVIYRCALCALSKTNLKRYLSIFFCILFGYLICIKPVTHSVKHFFAQLHSKF
jgi:hypothetical protein